MVPTGNCFIANEDLRLIGSAAVVLVMFLRLLAEIARLEKLVSVGEESLLPRGQD